MPQLILLGLVAIGGWYAWKALKREMARVDEEVREVERAAAKPAETLEYDAGTGKYRLKKRDGN